MATYTVYFADAGVAKTGLTLTWEYLKQTDGGGDEGSPPAFTEVGGGWYRFTYSPTENMVGVIDGSATLTSDADRYVPCDFDPGDGDLSTITGTDGVTLATAQANYAPAKAGDEMALEDDAITSDKFDESTAFPLESADSGSTQVARTGDDGDTLETLSDEIAVVDGNVDSIKSAVDTNLDTTVSSRGTADPGDQMNLADDAITSAKFDESTAFPLKSADTGATQVARTGADADTLETLSDQIDGVSAPSAADVADAVWDEAASGHVGAGSMGAEVQSHSTSAELSTHDGKLDVVDANVDSVLEDTGTTIPALIAALNDLSTADVSGITIDVLDLAATLKRILACVDGDTTVAGDNPTVHTIKAQGGATETTHSITDDGARTRS